jgi:hypothetical protein
MTIRVKVRSPRGRVCDGQCHLDRLARVLADAGWAVSRYDRPMPLLRVCFRTLPGVGDSITVRPKGVRRRMWFYSSTGEPIAPCRNLAWALVRVRELLVPCGLAAVLLDDRADQGAAPTKQCGSEGPRSDANAHEDGAAAGPSGTGL